jgi:succinyl-diaminopimelate desuccinylase
LYALKAIKDSGILPGRRVRIIFGTNEESGMTDMDYYFEKEPVPDYAFTPDAGYPIINAEKGYYVVRLKAPRTELGSGVCGAGSPLLYRIADMEGGVAPNVVPEHCHAVVVGASEGAQSELLLRQMVELAQDNAHIAVQLTDGGRVELTATGKSGHGSYPPSGINAISHMAEYLHKLSNHGSEPEDKFVSFIRTSIGFEAFGESLGLACNDPVHGKLTVNLAQIRMDDKVAEAILNIRYPVTVDGETVISKLKEKAADAGIEAEVTAYLAPLYIPPDHILIQKLSRAYEAVVGEKAGLLSIGGGTYARKLQNKGVAFGAGFKGTDTRAHQPDEFIVIEEIMRHGEICTQAIYELLRMEE